MASSFVVEFGCLGKMEYPMLCPFPLAPFRGKNRVGGVDSDGLVWTLRVAATGECMPTFLELAVNHGRLRMPGAYIFLIAFAFVINLVRRAVRRAQDLR